jgi:hypothetical protein
MENSPWEANSRSASSEIFRTLRNRDLRFRVHKSQPLTITTQSQINPLCTPQYFFKIRESKLCYSQRIFHSSDLIN